MYFAENSSELLTKEQLGSVNGLEFLNKMISGEFPAPPIAKTLNFVLADAKYGEVNFHGNPKFNAFNPLGTVHGGWYGAILDSAMACSIHSTLEIGEFYTTLEYSVHVVKSVKENGETLVANGKILHRGRKIATATGTIIGQESKKLYAHGTTSCIFIR